MSVSLSIHQSSQNSTCIITCTELWHTCPRFLLIYLYICFSIHLSIYPSIPSVNCPWSTSCREPSALLGLHFWNHMRVLTIHLTIHLNIPPKTQPNWTELNRPKLNPTFCRILGPTWAIYPALIYLHVCLFHPSIPEHKFTSLVSQSLLPCLASASAILCHIIPFLTPLLSLSQPCFLKALISMIFLRGS